MPRSPARPDDPAAMLVALIPDLARLTRYLVRDPDRAEDVAQEALARVWARLAGGADIADLRPYLMAAVRNLIRQGARAPRNLTLDEAPEPVAEPRLPARLALRDVIAAIGALPAHEARLVLRHAVCAQSYAEIASRENLPVGTVMSRLARCRAHLRQGCELPPSGPATARLTGSKAA